MPSESNSQDADSKLLESAIRLGRKNELTMITSPYLMSKFLLQATGKTRKNPPMTLTIPVHKSLSIPSVRSDSPCTSADGRDTNDNSLWTNGFDKMSVSDHSDNTPENALDNLDAELRLHEEPVTLPFRYKSRLVELGSDKGTTSCDSTTEAQDLSSREEDLSTALRWIRQEILEMKEQDKSLQKQFIDLRTSILQLRCIYEMHGSYSDISSLEGSTYSLNEPIKSPKVKRLLLAGEGNMNKLSISLPSSPMVERFKWRNDEYI